MTAALSKTTLKKLYTTMVRIRACEESLVPPIEKGIIRTPCHLYSGQEAVATGVCAALRKDDYIFGNHRSHGHFLAKGGSLQTLLAEIFCREEGCSRGRGGSMHLIDPDVGMLGGAPIVGGTISLAMGAAMSSSIRRDKRVTVSFFGDGATGEGVLFESLNFASLKKLPLLFVCENNLYSTHLPITECRPTRDIYSIATPFKITSHQVDGMDVLEVHRTARKAVDQCRRGEGPVFMECQTYRFRGHVGPDDNIQGTHTDIRPAAEVEAWRRKDPLSRLEKYLYNNKLFTKQVLKRLKRSAENEIEEALGTTQKKPPPRESELDRHVFK